jgi:hypothetical protein
MLRFFEHALRAPDFDEAPAVHHAETRAGMGRHIEIVGDQEKARSASFRDFGKQIENGSLNWEVERRHRFVEEKNVGFERECARQAHPLTLSRREMRRPCERHGGIESNEVQQALDFTGYVTE